MLKLKNISKTIGNKKILNFLSLEVERGEIAILLGSSGVGKSTLLRILNNLESFDDTDYNIAGSLASQVELDGKKLDLNLVNKNHIAGLVFQNFNLFEHLSVERNITLALEYILKKSKQESQLIAHELLNHYGLLNKSKCMVSELSGGQKQRLAIARTLALKPKIICLDEPTSALDPRLTSSIANDINELSSQGYIIIVATHDISLIEKMECTIHLMVNGMIAESIKSTDYFANKDKYKTVAAFISGAT